MMVLTISTIPTIIQNTASILTRPNHISHTKTQAILNIIKMEVLYDTQVYRAKQNYP
jgi:hypothetical protein